MGIPIINLIKHLFVDKYFSQIISGMTRLVKIRFFRLPIYLMSHNVFEKFSPIPLFTQNELSCYLKQIVCFETGRNKRIAC